ncbi:MAG: hypothetical protein SYC29_14610 [Planctomycetota bacterium]|nr:hypothetical protein [Planctomycetota bacterium]
MSEPRTTHGDGDVESGAPRDAAPPRDGRLVLCSWLIAIAVFAACLFLYSRNNTFSYRYHPDEAGKIEQILSNERNFNHPLLLLTATDVVSELAGMEDDRQEVVEAGRWVAAGCAALAVAALALLAMKYQGLWAGICVGAIGAMSHRMLQYAHFMKEDTALVMGLAVFFLALAWFEHRRTTWALIVLAAASAIAASGKYMGFITLPIAVPAVLLMMRSQDTQARKRAIRVFTRAFLATFAIINYHMILNLGDFFGSLKWEIKHSVTHHGGLTRSVPHTEYLERFANDTFPLLWALIGIHFLFLAITWKKRRGSEWIVSAFPLVYAAVLSCSTLVYGRYFLPVMTFAYLLAGLGIAEGSRVVLAGRWRFAPAARAVIVLIALGATLALQWRDFERTRDAFRHDHRAALIAWIDENLPAAAVIAQDAYVRLPVDEDDGADQKRRRLSQEVISARWVADLGPLDELRADGVTHVAVCRTRYGRLFSENRRPTEEAEAEYFRRKAFYEDLFATGTLLWERESGAITHLQPALKLYRIAAEEVAPPTDVHGEK